MNALKKGYYFWLSKSDEVRRGMMGVREFFLVKKGDFANFAI